MHTKKDNPDAPTEESIYNSALTKYHYLIFPHTLVKEQVPSYLSNCEPGTCLVKGSSSVPNHLTLCILGSDKKSIIYWRIPPVIINIGLNNILLSIDDIKYCILQSKSVITVKSFSITYGVATDPNLEIIAKQYKHSLNFYIRNKTNDQAHETDKQFINLAYHVDKETKKKHSPILESNTVPDVIEFSIIGNDEESQSNINISTSILPKNEEEFNFKKLKQTNIKIEDNQNGKVYTFEITDNLSFGDILINIMKEKSNEYGIYRYKTENGQRIRFIHTSKLIDDLNIIDICNYKLFIEPLKLKLNN